MIWLRRQYTEPFWGFLILSGLLARLDPLDKNIPFWWDFGGTLVSIYLIWTVYIVARLVVHTDNKKRRS